MTVKEMRVMLGMTQREFSEKFEIPYRTIQEWEGERRTPPKYVMNLLEFAVRALAEEKKEV